VVIAGALADNVEKSRLLLTGSILACIAFFLFYLWQPFLLNVLIMFLIRAATVVVSEGG